MEDFLKSLPKPAIAILAIAGALIFFALYDPPHTVCDVQAENLKEEMKGQIFAATVKKNKIPPLILQTQEACQQGNSPGSCFEYFEILKKMAKSIQNYSSECKTEFASIPEVKKAMKDGVTLMALMAWGSHPPELGPNRFGWFQESELSLFCRLKDVHVQSFGDESWQELRRAIYKLFPGEALPGAPTTDKAALTPEPPRATETHSDKDMWERSIFSVRCENYR
jgi:hypothetical protein